MYIIIHISILYSSILEISTDRLLTTDSSVWDIAVTTRYVNDLMFCLLSLPLLENNLWLVTSTMNIIIINIIISLCSRVFCW